ncbi:MAG TPA: bifunctional 5,10-methylenetetrahydrofolate dehydrogenase/5,10-methenyltetrahydrofolate cyclohydrolase [Candidatus Paceibacterota bacterium]|nr:bifunctional 5,10-methylenetetrahydrofolate dehydrogenase/5,10-methenyltetrahydrofolate cyclohydrolase [Candidatus Paceibacterota bacterium]
MKIFDGKKQADKILSDLRKRVKKERIKLKLAVISAGKDAASEVFIRNKKKAAERIGIKVLHYKFNSQVKEKRLLSKIENLNQDNGIAGIIVQLPLPSKLNAKKITEKIDFRKDVDGFQKKTRFSPPLISAILNVLKSLSGNLKSKKIIALVNSDFFGNVLKSSLKKEKIKISYLKNKKSSEIKSADIVISVCGFPNYIKGDMIKKGAVLIDGGIVVLKNGKVVGDVDRKSVSGKAGFLTPVPGGLGPLTVALLLKNVYYAAKHS